MKIQVKTFYLEMNQPSELRPKKAVIEGFRLDKISTPAPKLNRQLYVTVGQQWEWIDRLSWDAKDWVSWVDRNELQTSVAYLKDSIAGYFELELQADGDVEIAFFGLLPQFIGIGIGGQLLTQAVRSAWEMGAKRVWVHTCTLDHPHALNNYQARGFKVFRQEIHEQSVDNMDRS